jgi:drug/metabolite transporter (DMT)-like permease
MMIPYFFGLLFLDEHFSVWRLIGLILMIISIILSGFEGDSTPKDQKNRRTTTLFFILCSVVFCLNGMSSITSKLHQLPEYADMAVTPQVFVLLTAAFRVLFLCVVYFCIRIRDHRLPIEQRPTPLVFSPSIVSLMLLSALVEGAAFMLQLIGASHLPATVLYPLITGGVIILTALAGLLLFKQKLSRRATVGIILCFASTFLFL